MTSPNTPVGWRKSSRSGNESNCVEAIVTTGPTPDTTSPADPTQE